MSIIFVKDDATIKGLEIILANEVEKNKSLGSKNSVEAEAHEEEDDLNSVEEENHGEEDDLNSVGGEDHDQGDDLDYLPSFSKFPLMD